MVSKKSAAESVRSWGSFGLSFVGHNWSPRMERSASNTGINTDNIYILYIYYNYINTVYNR